MSAYTNKIDNVPPRGQGFNGSLLPIAKAAKKEGVSIAQMFEDLLTRSQAENWAGPPKMAEVERAYERCSRTKGAQNNKKLDVASRYDKDCFEELVANYTGHVPTHHEIKRASTEQVSTAGYLRALFHPDDIVCLCSNVRDPGTFKPAKVWIAKAEAGEVTQEFVIPNPMAEENRCDNDVAHHRHVLIEFDEVSASKQLDFWAASGVPLVALTWSGNKSYHGIVKVDCGTRQEWDFKVKRDLYAKRFNALGADVHCKNPARLTRLPGVQRRDTEQEQTSIGVWSTPQALGPQDQAEKVTLEQSLTRLDERMEIAGGMTAPPPEIYYWPKPGKYLKKQGNSYIEIDKAHIKRTAKMAGFSEHSMSDKEGFENLNELETFQQEVEGRAIIYAGGVAGQKVGVVETNVGTMLIQNQANQILGVPGDFSTITAFIDACFGAEQGERYTLWLKHAHEAVFFGGNKAGHCLIKVGAPGAGKSFSTDVLEFPVIGRRGSPSQYFSGKTNFNEDIASAELLVIDDDIGVLGSGARGKEMLNDNIKRVVASAERRIHAKNAPAFEVIEPLVQRLSMALNEDAEYLQAIPSLDTSMDGKLLLLKVEDFRENCKVECLTHEGMIEVKRKITEEIPAFIHHLLNMEVPEHLVDRRFGFRGYRAPELVQMVNDITPEKQVLNVIMMVIKRTEDIEELNALEKASAGQIHAWMIELGDGMSKQYEKLCPTANSLGKYLTRLAKREETVTHHGRNEENANVYTIRQPKAETELI